MGGPDNELTREEKIESIIPEDPNPEDTIEDVYSWDGTWSPPEDGETVGFELTGVEIEAIQSSLRRRAVKHYRDRGFAPYYMKYNVLLQKFGGDELLHHIGDPKYIASNQRND